MESGNRKGGESRGIATDRLDVIDARLARIEEHLRRILADRPRL
jgi:hypothetical protein